MFRSLLLFLTTAALAQADVYCWGFLRAYPDRKPLSQEEGEKIQSGHMAHMQELGRQGKLLLAGPLADSPDIRGIVVHKCDSVAQAQEWTAPDPTVINKRLFLESYLWNGPPNLGEPLASRMKADPTHKIEMTRLPLIIYRKTDKWIEPGPTPVLMQHGKYLQGLLADGRLRMAGPFMAEDRKSGVPGNVGVLVFANRITLDEAKALAAADPVIQQGYVRPEAYIWFVAEDGIPKPAASSK